MLEIVQEILDAEKTAEETLRKAAVEAEAIRARADEKANAILRDARNEAQRSSLEQIEKARRRFSADTERELNKERQKTAAFEDEHAAEIDSLVTEIVDLIVRTDTSG